MIKVTYTTFSKLLNKSFVNEKIVKSMSDFNLFATSLNLNVTKIETQEIK